MTTKFCIALADRGLQRSLQRGLKCVFFSPATMLFMIMSCQLNAQPANQAAAIELSRLMVSTFVTERSDVNDNESVSIIQDRRIAITSDKLPGTWLYYQLNTGKDNTLYRQRVIELTAIDNNTVVQALYTPKDLAAWENVWDKTEVLEAASADDFDVSLNTGCEQVWTRIKSSPISGSQWRGYVDPKTCKVFSERRGKKIRIEGESILSLSSIKHAERGFSVDGKQLWGSAPNEFNTLARQYMSSGSLVEFSEPAAWRKPDPANMVQMKLDAGDVWIELAPQFAPRHVENLRTLIKQNYFDNTSIIRSQDNYVVQWGDANANTKEAKGLGKANASLEVEFFRDVKATPNFTALDSRDAYAERVGMVDGFPVAADARRLWLTHCYGMLGVGRDIDSTSGNASSLYVVTGHAPRHLDRNVTLIGRVLSGMPYLSALPRGNGALGFYEDSSQHVTVRSMRIGSSLATDLVSNNELPADVEIMRTDTETFKQFVQLRANRKEEWFLEPTGRIGLCNIAVPIRGFD